MMFLLVEQGLPAELSGGTRRQAEAIMAVGWFEPSEQRLHGPLFL
jgi:hypothetical protein